MQFTRLYQEQILGSIAGLDRIRFRGTDRMLSNKRGFGLALHDMGVLFKDFGRWAEAKTKWFRARVEAQAQRLGIGITYLRTSGVDKEALARQIAKEHGVADDGSICMFSVVESCVAPTVCGDRSTRRLHVEMRPRKCVFLYYYFDHPRVGFGNVRIQTWAPYTVHICLNGRHWLEKQLMAKGMGYQKSGNCFTWLADVAYGQRLLDQQLKTNWPGLLNAMVRKAFPGVFHLCSPFQLQYYWSADETEFATDVMFRSKPQLDALFPTLLFHGMRVSDCHNVLRFFGMRGETKTRGRAPYQIQSSCRKRHEGIRIRHWVGGDSVKMYNKAGTVLRVETTINKPRKFKAFRSANDDTTQRPKWQRMRKGVNDLHRRCDLSRKSNERYLDAMTAAQVETTLRQTVEDVCNRTLLNGRPVRGLNPWNALDFQLVTFLAKGEWALNGFRNADLRRWLKPQSPQDPSPERKKLSAKVTRLIGILRAHGLVRKVPKENRYVLTPKGHTLASALLVASNVQVKQLAEIAA
jgi:hypothetical protein